MGSWLQINSIDELLRLSSILLKSGLMPKDLKSVEAVASVILAGQEIGLKPLQSIQSIALINGRVALYGHAPLALVRRSGLLLKLEEWIEGEGDGMAGVCSLTRKGVGEQRTSFSVGQAKRAGLWNKHGPWQLYPERMLIRRARSIGLWDLFGDVLFGYVLQEDAIYDPDEVSDVVEQDSLEPEVPDSSEDEEEPQGREDTNNRISSEQIEVILKLANDKRLKYQQIEKGCERDYGKILSLLTTQEADDLISRLQSYQPPPIEKPLAMIERR